MNDDEMLVLGSWDNLRLDDIRANGLDKKLWFDGIPAYPLGYLLRKLPSEISVELQKRVDYDNEWSWNCVAQSPDEFYWVEDGFLEDVICELAIKLFEEDILKRRDS